MYSKKNKKKKGYRQKLRDADEKSPWGAQKWVECPLYPPTGAWQGGVDFFVTCFVLIGPSK